MISVGIIMEYQCFMKGKELLTLLDKNDPKERKYFQPRQGGEDRTSTHRKYFPKIEIEMR